MCYSIKPTTTLYCREGRAGGLSHRRIHGTAAIDDIPLCLPDFRSRADYDGHDNTGGTLNIPGALLFSLLLWLRLVT